MLKDAHVVALCIKLFDGVGRGSLHLPCETSRFFVFFGVECRAGGGEGRRKIAGGVCKHGNSDLLCSEMHIVVPCVLISTCVDAGILRLAWQTLRINTQGG